MNILLSLTLLFCASVFADVSERQWESFSVKDRQALRHIIKEAKSTGINSELLERKIHEGLSKGVAPARIHNAVVLRYKHLKQIHTGSSKDISPQKQSRLLFQVEKKGFVKIEKPTQKIRPQKKDKALKKPKVKKVLPTKEKKVQNKKDKGKGTHKVKQKITQKSQGKPVIQEQSDPKTEQHKPGKANITTNIQEKLERKELKNTDKLQKRLDLLQKKLDAKQKSLNKRHDKRR